MPDGHSDLHRGAGRSKDETASVRFRRIRAFNRKQGSPLLWISPLRFARTPSHVTHWLRTIQFLLLQTRNATLTWLPENMLFAVGSDLADSQGRQGVPPFYYCFPAARSDEIAAVHQGKPSRPGTGGQGRFPLCIGNRWGTTGRRPAQAAGNPGVHCGPGHPRGCRAKLMGAGSQSPCQRRITGCAAQNQSGQDFPLFQAAPIDLIQLRREVAGEVSQAGKYVVQGFFIPLSSHFTQALIRRRHYVKQSSRTL